MNPLQNMGPQGFAVALVVVALVASGTTFLLVGDDRDKRLAENKTEERKSDEQDAAEPRVVTGTRDTPRITTPSPGGGVSPSPVSTAPTTNGAVPVPTMRLVARGIPQNGIVGLTCWQPLDVCTESSYLDLPGVDPLLIRERDLLTIRVDAEAAPLSLTAVVRDVVPSGAPTPNNPEKLVKQRLTLSGQKVASFPVTVAPGTYLVTVTGSWREGTVSRIYKIEVQKIGS